MRIMWQHISSNPYQEKSISIQLDSSFECVNSSLNHINNKVVYNFPLINGLSIYLSFWWWCCVLPHALILHITAYAVVAKLLNLVHVLIQFSLKVIMLPSSTKCEHIFEFRMIKQTNEWSGIEATKQRGDKHFALSILMSHNCIYDEVSQILDLPLNSIINFVVYAFMDVCLNLKPTSGTHDCRHCKLLFGRTLIFRDLGTTFYNYFLFCVHRTNGAFLFVA